MLDVDFTLVYKIGIRWYNNIDFTFINNFVCVRWCTMPIHFGI